MLDTTVTIVGNAITMPEWRRLERSGSLVTHFKVASHPRRYDRANDRWMDAEGVRVRVTCWRRLAEGVAVSVKVGDPVIVTGRLYCRDWTTEDGQHRVTYEVEATAVGHDLARGRARFERVKAVLGTSVVEDSQTDNRVAGEASEAVPELNQQSARLAAELDDEPIFRTDVGLYSVPDTEAGDDGEFEAAPVETEGVETEGADEVTAALADLDDVISQAVGTLGVAPLPDAAPARRRRGRIPAST